MMMLSVYTSALLLLGIQSPVLGNPVLGPDQNLRVDIATPDTIRVMGKLATTGYVHTRSSTPKDVDHLNRRAGVPWSIVIDKSQALRLHNNARENLGLEPLTWDTDLEDQATVWAQHLADIQDLKIQDVPDLGENVAVRFSTEPVVNPITLATKGWLAKADKYHDEIIPRGDFKSYATYTQCVWKTTTHVGIASASDGNGSWYTVAYYSPAGNIIGQRAY